MTYQLLHQGPEVVEIESQGSVRELERHYTQQNRLTGSPTCLV